MRFIAGFLAFTVALAAVSCTHFRDRAALATGQPFPAMRFSALDGSSTTLVPAPGRVTFVNVFATWCPPCKAETPDLVAFASRASSKGVDVIGIDQEETAAQVQAFRDRYHIGYPIVIDTGRETKDILGARIIPRTIVVDGKGIVRAVVSGPMTADQMSRLAAEAGANS
jgi:thiol-disulfide isomerase/thioredoxin